MEPNKQIQTVDSTTDIIDVIGAGNRLVAMMEFVKQNLKKGNDYMSIAGGKPTLLKSGAEKMNILMGYSAEYEKVKDMMNPEKETYYVEIKCVLRDKQGRKIAEGIGSCNNKERNRASIPFYDSLNTVLKMAEKRAYVGATLNANALSQFYTQDLEDNEQVERAPVRDKEGASVYCVDCGKAISEKVGKFSAERFGKLLCMGCQTKAQPI